VSSVTLARRISIGAVVAWGLLHLVGGVALISSSTAQSLQQLGGGGGAAVGDPGPVAGAVVSFHGFNIAAAGVAVLVLAWRGRPSNWPRGIGTALVLMAVLDAGLAIFLIAPGYLKLSDGLWGPALLVVAAVAALLGSIRSSDQTPDRHLAIRG
jgi:hypothetical protein